MCLPKGHQMNTHCIQLLIMQVYTARSSIILVFRNINSLGNINYEVVTSSFPKLINDYINLFRNVDLIHMDKIYSNYSKYSTSNLI